MVRTKVTGKSLSKFLNTWDREIYDLNIEIKKIHLKQKKEKIVFRKKEGLLFRLNK